MKNKIDYTLIFKKAWSLVWHNRFMWVLGFFMMIGGGFNWISADKKSSSDEFSVVFEYLHKHLLLTVCLIGMILLVLLALYVLATISKAAIVKAVCNIKIYSQMKIRTMLSSNLCFFWRLFFLDLIFVLVIMGMIVVLILPMAVLFSMRSYIVGSFLALIAAAILIPVVIGAYFIKKYAIFHLIIADTKVKSSIEFGYDLFVTRFRESIVMSLLVFALSLLIFVAMLAIISVVVVIAALLGWIAYLIFGSVGVISTTIVFGLCLLAVLFFMGSFVQAWLLSCWTMFFREIGSIKTEEKVEKKEVVLESEGQPAQPEAV